MSRAHPSCFIVAVRPLWSVPRERQLFQFAIVNMSSFTTRSATSRQRVSKDFRARTLGDRRPNCRAAGPLLLDAGSDQSDLGS
jgi:hypothetical protein